MVKDFGKRERLAVAQQWLDGWGAVVRERQVTGDPAAVPKADFAIGQRGNPGQLPGLWEIFMSVESLIEEWQGPGIRQVLELAHIASVEHIVSVVAYTLADGSVVELDHGADPPNTYLSAEPRMVTVRKRADWRRITFSREAEQGIRQFGMSRYRFFGVLYRDFQWALIDCRIFGKKSVRDLTEGIWA